MEPICHSDIYRPLPHASTSLKSTITFAPFVEHPAVAAVQCWHANGHHVWGRRNRDIRCLCAHSRWDVYPRDTRCRRTRTRWPMASSHARTQLVLLVPFSLFFLPLCPPYWAYSLWDIFIPLFLPKLHELVRHPNQIYSKLHREGVNVKSNFKELLYILPYWTIDTFRKK